MNKLELIEAISGHAKITKADAGRALDATLEIIHKALKKGDRVALLGFGNFSVPVRTTTLSTANPSQLSSILDRPF